MSLPGRLAALLLLLCLAVAPAGSASTGWNGDTGAIALEALVDAPARESLVRKPEAAPDETTGPEAPIASLTLSRPCPGLAALVAAIGHDARAARARGAVCQPRAPPPAQV